MKTSTIIAFSVLGVLLVALFIKSGFKTYKHENYWLTQTGSCYIVANYSEYECVPDLIDGGIDCGYDYWTEDVSDHWQAEYIYGQSSVNANIDQSKIQLIGNRFYIKDYPSIYNHSKKDFDNYSKNKHYNFRVYFKKDDYRSINYDEYTKIAKSYDAAEPIVIDYWYFFVLNVKYENEAK